MKTNTLRASPTFTFATEYDGSLVINNVVVASPCSEMPKEAIRQLVDAKNSMAGHLARMDRLDQAARCAIAALTQNATFPADIALAVRALRDAIQS